MSDGGRAALLIDDNRLDQLNTRNLLLGAKAGYDRLEWLDHWPGAAVALQKGPFDLFIVDINLGVESGLDVIRDLRAAGVLAPIIAFTGNDDPDVDRACTDAGASDFLVKDRADRDTFERAVRYAERQADVHRELDRLNAALERRATAENDQARLMRFAIEQSTDGILLTKSGATLADHAIVYVNVALCRLLDRRAGELLGGDLSTLFADAATIARLEHALGLHGAIDGPALLRRAARTIAVDLRATPLKSTDHVVTHYVWTCRHGAGTRAGPAMPHHRFEAVGQAAAGFAHELNDRLTTVIGNLDLLASRGGDERALKPARSALRAAEELVAQSRLLVAITTGDEIAIRRPVDPSTLLTRLAGILHDTGQAHANVEVRPGDGPAWLVDADPIRLAFALVALASRMRVARFDRALAFSWRNIVGTHVEPHDHVAISVHVDDVDREDVDVGADDTVLHDLAARQTIVADGRGGVVATLLLPRASESG